MHRELASHAHGLLPHAHGPAGFPPPRLAVLDRTRVFHVYTPTTMRASREPASLDPRAPLLPPVRGCTFIYEVLSNRIVDKRPVSPEPPGRLVRNRGAHEPDGFGIPPLPPGLVVDCVQLVRARAQAGESLAGTHHSLSGASRLSLLRAHEETENRKQPAT